MTRFAGRGSTLVWRRLAAYGVDSLLMAVYIGVLFLIGLRVGPVVLTAWQSHLLGFASLTLPIVLVFAAMEASGWRGTFGKRLMSLRLNDYDGDRPSFLQTLIRNALKFLPWELSHVVIHRIEGWPAAPAPLMGWQIGLLALSYGLALVWVASLWWRQSPYDALARVRVERATSEAPSSGVGTG